MSPPLHHTHFHFISRQSWWVDSAQALRTRRSARRTFLNSGTWSLLFSGRDTGTQLWATFIILTIHVSKMFSIQAEWMCADICAAPEDTVMTCDDCKMGIQANIWKENWRCLSFKSNLVKTQAAVDQLLEEGTIATIVDTLSPEICKDNPTEECPAAVDAVITQVWSHHTGQHHHCHHTGTSSSCCG